MNILPLTNRIRKNARHFDKWARRQGLEAYRIYDGDLDEFPFTADRYGDRLYVAIYAGKGPQRWQELGEKQQQSLLREALTDGLALSISTAETAIHFKTRQRQRGEQQYERLARERAFFPVTENRLQFWVNLTDYLDTGLFLDHRQTRSMVAAEAAGKSLLNLFAYTCSFSVYAAGAGAGTTLSLDLSSTYLDWGHRNLELNGLAGEHHRFEKTDVLAWLAEEPREKFDLIVLDPPTFSNSKSMEKTLDIQRDHAWLINRCLIRLTQVGRLYFSTNHRGFKIDAAAIAAQSFQEITQQTIPPDFRKGKIHQSYILS